MDCNVTQPRKHIFVTVGTTSFDALTKSVSKSNFLDTISFHGYTNLIIQYGKGSVPLPPAKSNHKQQQKESFTGSEFSGTYIASNGSIVHWKVYSFKPSLECDMKNADLIISHAGAGSIMEGLEQCRIRNSIMDSQHINNDGLLCKKMVVVINDKLMDNHQMELAEALESRGYLLMITDFSSASRKDGCRNILHKIQGFRPKNFDGGNQATFGNLLSDFMGFRKIL